ncbi:MAG: hypothetical protein COA43_12140 [Robiginitomaculum sp.]|nr:MAG: hypothetical protein COA43_12140 [Robiginitomaculum sp.]
MSEHIVNKPSVWFWVLTVILALWALMGLWVFYDFMTTTPEKMAKYVVDGTYTQAYVEYYNDFPIWHTVVFGIAIFSSAFGALGLVLRRAWAAPLFTLSLVCVVISTFATHAIDKAHTMMSTGQTAMSGVVLGLAILAFWHAKKSKAKGWLK